MVSSTITLDKKSSSASTSSSSATATAANTASASALASASDSIISIPLNASNSNGISLSGSSSSALNLSEQKISILFPKCKPRVTEHYQTSVATSTSTTASFGISAAVNSINNNINNSNSDRGVIGGVGGRDLSGGIGSGGMSAVTSSSKSSDVTGTSSSLTTATSLGSASFGSNTLGGGSGSLGIGIGGGKSYTIDMSGYRGVGNSRSSTGYDLLGGGGAANSGSSELNSQLNNNHYDSGSRIGGSSNRHTSSLDKYSFYYNNQPPPLSSSPTENNLNTTGGSSQFLPSDDEEDEEELRKDSYPRHGYYSSRYYNLPKQDPGTPSTNRYPPHWDLSPSSVLSYSTPSTTNTTSSMNKQRPSLKSSYTKVLQSPLEDESDIEDKLKYFNYQNEMHSTSSSKMGGGVGENKPSIPSGIYSNYKTNEMIVFNDIDGVGENVSERRRVQHHQSMEIGGSTEVRVGSAGTGLRVSPAVMIADSGSRDEELVEQLQPPSSSSLAVNEGDNLDGGMGTKIDDAMLHNKTMTSASAIGSSPALPGSGSNIMEYEGSPRRFGLSLNEDSSLYYLSSNFKLNLTSPSLQTPPRPGFPQRVLTPANNNNSINNNNNNNNSSNSAATTPTPNNNNSHYYPTRSPTLLEQVSSGLNGSVTFDANALLSEFDAKRAAVSIVNRSNLTDSVSSKLNVLRLDTSSPSGDYSKTDEFQQQQQSLKVTRCSPEHHKTTTTPSILGLTSTTADDAPTFGAGSFTTPITASSTFDYLYEFSETRKVLEEFFKCPTTEDVEKAFEKFSESGDDVESLDIHYDYPSDLGDSKTTLETTYIGTTSAVGPQTTTMEQNHVYHHRHQSTNAYGSSSINNMMENSSSRMGNSILQKSPTTTMHNNSKNNNNNNLSNYHSNNVLVKSDDDCCDEEENDERDDGEVEDEEDEEDDLEGVGNNLKYMINVKCKPRIKNGYSSFRKKKQEKNRQLSAVVGGGVGGIGVPPSGIVNDDNDDGEDEEEIDIYSATHHHNPHHHNHQPQQQSSSLQQQHHGGGFHQRMQPSQEQTQQQQQQQGLGNVRQHVTLRQQQQQHQYQDHERHFSLYLDPGSRASSCDVINEAQLDSTQFMTTNGGTGSGKRFKGASTNGTNGGSGGGGGGKKSQQPPRRPSKNFNYSPDTTDYESNCGDYDSEISLKYGSEFGGLMTNGCPNGPAASCVGDGSAEDCNNTTIGGLSSIHGENTPGNMQPGNTPFSRYYTSMPVLEDGLSSGHVSDTENNNPVTHTLPTPDLINSSHKLQQQHPMTSPTTTTTGPPTSQQHQNGLTNNSHTNNNNNALPDGLYGGNGYKLNGSSLGLNSSTLQNNKIFKNRDPELESLYTINTIQSTPPPPAPAPHRKSSIDCDPQLTMQQLHSQQADVHAALKDIRTCLQRTKTLASPTTAQLPPSSNHTQQQQTTGQPSKHPMISATDKLDSPVPSISPVWIPRSRDGKLVVAHSTPPMNNSSSPGLLLPTTPTTGPPNERSANQSSEKDSLLHGISSKNLSALDDDEDPDTDLETDRLLGHQRLDDQGFYDDNSKSWSDRKTRSSLLHKLSPKQQTGSGVVGVGTTGTTGTGGSSLYSSSNGTKPGGNQQGSSLLRQGLSTLLSPTSAQGVGVSSLPEIVQSSKLSPALQNSVTGTGLNTSGSGNLINLNGPSDVTGSTISPSHSPDQTSPTKLEKQTTESGSPNGSTNSKSDTDKKKKNKNKEVLIEGVLFRARYLGSTQLVCEGQPTKSTRMMQAEEAVSRIKSPDGETQPSTEVDLFISTEKIMVLNTDLKEIMMDHALRTISYIADIGDLVVLMARRRFVPQDVDSGDSGTGGNGGGTTTAAGTGNQSGGSQTTPPQKSALGSVKGNRTPKMICHVFESEEAQFIAQSIGQAFQVAYMEFLKANGIEDHSFMKEMDYQEVLNSQEIFGDELEIFAKKELQKEVVVPKAKGEILGVVIVESGWGSMLPTVVIANLASAGAAARCGQLNIGDQIIAINGLSLVGLPLSTCQSYIKNTKNQTVVKFTVVPCAPVVEVKIKRPNTKYQLGFSVQNGVICSLLRGGIAERGGVRVGHRIIEINNQSVVAVPHEKIVNLLATSVGEILMKTMPTSMFRLLTGQENPVYI
ncbi:uncharacterized protein LOC129740167 [Uranotaenia lowii]|nr:uncharacterized protein LOC129740167 [Uranotaenia lowii]XP_055587751.1 uncharacterized protein LOC129740167 [Uranotaenia lowii]